MIRNFYFDILGPFGTISKQNSLIKASTIKNRDCLIICHGHPENLPAFGLWLEVIFCSWKSIESKSRCNFCQCWYSNARSKSGHADKTEKNKLDLSLCLRATVRRMLFSINTTCTNTHKGSIQKEVWKSCGVTGGHCHLGGGYCAWLMFPCKQKLFMSPRLSFQLLSWKCALNLLDLPQGSCVCVCVREGKSSGGFYWSCRVSPCWQTSKNTHNCCLYFSFFSYLHWKFTQSFIRYVFHCSWVLRTC